MPKLPKAMLASQSNPQEKSIFERKNTPNSVETSTNYPSLSINNEMFFTSLPNSWLHRAQVQRVAPSDVCRP